MSTYPLFFYLYFLSSYGFFSTSVQPLYPLHELNLSSLVQLNPEDWNHASIQLTLPKQKPWVLAVQNAQGVYFWSSTNYSTPSFWSPHSSIWQWRLYPSYQRTYQLHIPSSSPLLWVQKKIDLWEAWSIDLSQLNHPIIIQTRTTPPLQSASTSPPGPWSLKTLNDERYCIQKSGKNLHCLTIAQILHPKILSISPKLWLFYAKDPNHFQRFVLFVGNDQGPIQKFQHVQSFDLLPLNAHQWLLAIFVLNIYPWPLPPNAKVSFYMIKH